MKSLLSAAGLAAMACSFTIAPADAATWNFTFHNLHHVYTDLVDAGTVTDYGYQSINGYFIADDLNHDNRIDISEIRTIGANGMDYANERGANGAWIRNEISTFSYDGNTLEIEAAAYRSVLNTRYGVFYASGGYSDDFYAEPTSYITVTATAVPEPASVTLFFLGLLGMAGFGAVRSGRTPI